MNILLICLLILSVLTLVAINFSNDELSQYRKQVDSHKFMKHALGGVQGHTYLNTIEALDLNYQKGHRLFEVDVSLTSDDKLVLVHGWSNKDWKERIGENNFDKNNRIPTFESFMKFKIQGIHKASSFYNLVEFIRSHNDVYVMIDIGRANYEETSKRICKMVSVAENNPNVLNRLIIGGHTTEMIEAIKSCYDFKLLNLYWPFLKWRDPQLKTKKDFFSIVIKTIYPVFLQRIKMRIENYLIWPGSME